MLDANPEVQMDPETIYEHFLTLTRMFSSIQSDLKHMASKPYVLEQNKIHVAECPAAKKYAWLGPLAAILSGLGFLGGVLFSRI